MPYTVFFANKPEATAAAQVIKVTDQLDLPGADLSTLSLGTITIGNQTVTPEDHINPIAGVREYDADVDLRPTKNLLVHVNAKLNLDNGLLAWTFTSINPATGLPLAPDDPNGFLDPGQEGSMLFTVMPRKNLKTGTIVRDQASIVFDANAAMLTPIWFNTIDNDKPSSQVNPLAGVQNALNFPVSWKGQDVGSGLRDFTIYVSDNGGAYTPWLTNTTDTSATFTGVGGHTYAFYSQARDNTFNLENAHSQPDTVTQLPNIATDVSSQVSVTRSAFRFNRATGRFAQTRHGQEHGQFRHCRSGFAGAGWPEQQCRAVQQNRRHERDHTGRQSVPHHTGGRYGGRRKRDGDAGFHQQRHRQAHHLRHAGSGRTGQPLTRANHLPRQGPYSSRHPIREVLLLWRQDFAVFVAIRKRYDNVRMISGAVTGKG